MRFNNKNEVKYFIISACKRQYGFAPHLNEIIINNYNKSRVVFTVCGRMYLIKYYKDIPIVTLVNFVLPHDF